MRRSELYEYDLCLCQYVWNNVFHYLPDDPSPPNVANSSQPSAVGKGRRTNPFQLYDSLPRPYAFRHWLKCCLSPGLFTYLCCSNPPKYLLTAEQLEDLASTVNEGPIAFAGLLWAPMRSVHDDYMRCLPEIRAHLARPIAEKFAMRSEKFAAQLVRDRLKLNEGIEIVATWLVEVRKLLGATGKRDLLPRPLGKQPTPDCPDDLGEDHLALVARIRVRFEKKPELKYQSRNKVYKAVRGNKQKVLRALDWMIDHGEYFPDKR